MISEQPAVQANSPERGSPAEELEYRLRQQQLASEYAVFALRNHDVQALLQEAARVCAEGLQSTLCKIMEYLPEEHQFIVRAGVGWKPGVVGHARTGADTASPTGYAFTTGEPVISNHLEGESRFRTPELLVEHGVKRAMNALIESGGERFGVIEVDSPLEGQFTEADLVFVIGFANLLGVALERQRLEDALMEKEMLLQQALEHQEVLTWEISHRVKNSLSIVAGMLAMQSRASADPALTRALTDARTRVGAIAKVYDLLWRKAEIRTVNLAELLAELCDHLRASAPDHELTYQVAPVTVATDQAISIGILANEVITNALKYAYAGGVGPVQLSLAESRAGGWRLEVRDYGAGLPPDFDSVAGGLGRRVISSLSRQLGAQAEWKDGEPGTHFVLSFRPQSPPLTV